MKTEGERSKYIIAYLITEAENNADEADEYLHRVCRYCYKYIKDDRKMQAHMVMAHAEQVGPAYLRRKYACLKCQSTFKFPSTLTRHVRIRHSRKDGKYLCGVCMEKLTLSDVTDFVEHFKIHKI